MNTILELNPSHFIVEFIWIFFKSLLPESSEEFLFFMIVICPKFIILFFLQQTQMFSKARLASLSVFPLPGLSHLAKSRRHTRKVLLKLKTTQVTHCLSRSVCLMMKMRSSYLCYKS
jgi:hypothetical protein